VSLDNIKREVGMMAADVDFRMAEAQRSYVHGDDRAKVAAAGDLVWLKAQKAMLDVRMRELAAMPETAAEDAWQWLKEQWFNLMLRLDSWLAHG
jgi:hypothetical protein